MTEVVIRLYHPTVVTDSGTFAHTDATIQLHPDEAPSFARYMAALYPTAEIFIRKSKVTTETHPVLIGRHRNIGKNEEKRFHL